MLKFEQCSIQSNVVVQHFTHFILKPKVYTQVSVNRECDANFVTRLVHAPPDFYNFELFLNLICPHGVNNGPAH